MSSRLNGKFPRNGIGNPLETTIALSHLIFEGTLEPARSARAGGIGYKVETAGGALRVREDEPAPRSGLGCTGHREARGTRYPGSLRGLGPSAPRRIYHRRRL